MPPIIIPSKGSRGLDWNHAQHTEYAYDNSYGAQYAEIFKPIIQIPEVSEEAKEGKEEQLPRVMTCECCKPQQS